MPVPQILARTEDLVPVLVEATCVSAPLDLQGRTAKQVNPLNLLKMLLVALHKTWGSFMEFFCLDRYKAIFQSLKIKTIYSDITEPSLDTKM